MIESGRLLREIEHSGKRKLTRSALIYYPRKERIPYGPSQFYGVQSKNIPERPYLGISEVTRSAAIQLAQRYIDHVLREAER